MISEKYNICYLETKKQKNIVKKLVYLFIIDFFKFYFGLTQNILQSWFSQYVIEEHDMSYILL